MTSRRSQEDVHESDALVPFSTSVRPATQLLNNNGQPVGKRYKWVVQSCTGACGARHIRSAIADHLVWVN